MERMKKPLLILVILIAVLQIADVLTTQHILTAGGVELNPWMVPVADHPFLIWIPKAVLVVLAALTAYTGASLGQARLVAGGLLIIAGWYLVVALNNALVISGHGGILYVLG